MDDEVLGWEGPFLVVRDVDGVRHAIRHTWIAGIRDVGAGDEVTLIVTKFGSVSVPAPFQDVIGALRRFDPRTTRRLGESAETCS